MTIDVIGLCTCGGTIWRRPSGGILCDECNKNIWFVSLNTWWRDMKNRRQVRKVRRKLELNLEQAKLNRTKIQRKAREARYQLSNFETRIALCSQTESIWTKEISELEKLLKT